MEGMREIFGTRLTNNRKPQTIISRGGGRGYYVVQPARLELEGQFIGPVLSDVVNLPLDDEPRWLFLCEEGNVEEVAFKISQDLKKTRTTES